MRGIVLALVVLGIAFSPTATADIASDDEAPPTCVTVGGQVGADLNQCRAVVARVLDSIGVGIGGT